MNLKEAIEDYISVAMGGKREKEIIRKLLLKDRKKKLDDVQLPYEVEIESLQVNEALRGDLSEDLLGLLIETTNSKKRTQERIVLFTEYLYKKHKIELELDEVFNRATLDKYDRLVDLLKLLNEGKTKGELENYYSISRRQLNLDINELTIGTKILGQDVKIRDHEYDEDKKIVYQSTIHPIFLPLNMTEIYYLIMGLKTLSKENKVIAGSTYDDLADRVYSQLSDYARNKIDHHARKIDMKFPKEEDYKKYKGTRDEEGMAKADIKNQIMYLYKSGTICTIQLKGDSTPISNCYIDYDINHDNVYIKESFRGERIRMLDINQILDIKYDYL